MNQENITKQCLLNLLRSGDFKRTLVDNTWNCLAVAAKDDSPVTLLYITGSNSMHNVYHPMVSAAAESTGTPLWFLNGYAYDNQPLIHSLQGVPLPQLYLMDSVGTIAPRSRYIGLRTEEAIKQAIIEYQKNQGSIST
jgi:hypothetical protein